MTSYFQYLSKTLGDNLTNLFKKEVNKLFPRQSNPRDPKIFCIGRNKTGTTSLKQALSDWGYSLGNQKEAELYIDCYKERNFRAIARYCRRYDAFQDAPFSWPFTFMAMDILYPESKFILTIRDSPKQWYDSLLEFHSKLFGKGKPPTKDDLKNALYRYKGWMWEVNQTVYNAPENDPYNEKLLIKNYVRHNQMVKNYFRKRPDDLLVINPAEEKAYFKLADFLSKEPLYTEMPWENRTKAIKSSTQ